MGSCLVGFTLVPASAQTTTIQPSVLASTNKTEAVRLPEVTVQGRAADLAGRAGSATEGTVGAAQLATRPLLRPGELVETVPGVIITQHSGAGKANQYFLRGFNLDHGTDFATSLDGMPVNLPTHGHGQGYTDLNFLIPELVGGITYKKGPYYASEGDFASAGAANLSYVSTLPQSLLQLEGGSFGYTRGVFASSPKLGRGHLLYAGEVYHNDGPWVRRDDFWKGNGVLRYSQGDDTLGWSLTAMGYHGEWNATDQLAQRAVTSGAVDRFGTLDPTTGGHSQRYSLLAEWHRSDDRMTTRVLAYGCYYDLDLFSNFSYALASPAGDQFEQQDRRYTGGLKASHEWHQAWFGRPVENTAGAQLRADGISNGLFQTVGRTRQDKLDYAGGTINATTRADDVLQASVAPYYENKIQWAEKFRTVAGVRADLYHFDVASDSPANSGARTAFLASPKASLIFGPWAKTELYVNGGLGFHSNDGRGTTTTMDPATATAVSKVNPLVRTYGAEVGVRTGWLPGLQSTVSAWWLDIDSELVFVGDAGTTEPSRPSRRVGVEFANYYQPAPWLTLDADLSLSRARFRDADSAAKYIPGSIESVLAAGVSVRAPHGFFGSLRLRYFGPRSLIEDNSVRSTPSVLVNAQVGYEFTKNWKLTVELFNLLDRKADDIAYYYESRLRGEAINPDPALTGGYNDVHFHPAEPRSVRVALTGRF